ncbi:MAG: TonB-dependent receptor, partial [Myxococcota bacterium]
MSRWSVLAAALCVGVTLSAAADDLVEPGRLVLVVFEADSGAPRADTPVYADEQLLGQTDAFGRVLADVEPGTYPLSIQVRGERLPIADVLFEAGFTTEVLVSHYSDGRPPDALIEQPDAGAARGVEDTDGPVGTVTGRIVSAEDGRPVARARVFVRGSRADAQTDSDGRFTVEIASGTRDLSVIHDRYATQAANGVVVVAGQETEIMVELVPAGLALDDFTISAPRIDGGTSALLDERRTSSSVGDVLGAEQMSRSGDSSAASALTRVTGLTLVGGRFVYVRGLGERYSSVLLNGASLPSPEPERRVVPLDMFPAGILESVTIQKTFSPDMPGEFGGGSIQLRTKNIPTEPVFKVGLSGGYNSVTTFKEGLDYEGGRMDWLGAGARSRRLPEEVAAASANSRIAASGRFCTEDCLTGDDLERFGEQLDNNYTPTERDLPPDLGVSLTAGTGSETALFGRPAGVIFGASYANQWQHREFTRGYYTLGDDELVLQNEYDFIETGNQVNVSGILAVGASPAEGHELKATTLVLRRTGDTTRVFSGENAELDTDIRTSRLRYVERQLLVQQLSGEHELADRGPTFTWRYSFARATRVEPDRRQLQYNFGAGSETFLLSQRSNGNARIFSGLLDRNHDLGGELRVPFGPEIGKDKFRPTIRLGGMFSDKARNVDTRRYQFAAAGADARDPDLNVKKAEEIFTPENIGPNGYEFVENTLPTDNYSATHTIAAGYLMGEVPLARWIRAMAGARVEHSDQYTTTFPLFATAETTTVESEIVTTDVLPAATLTLSPVEKVNIRLGYGRTVSRPDFREMSPAIFADVAGGRTVRGNPDIQRGKLDNYDLRFEFYPQPGETFSVGGFYKRFYTPIETVLVISSERSITWENTDGATLVGVELDARKKLDFVHNALRDVYVAGNVALIQSRVTGIGGAGTNSERAMQGQSPYVVNATLG